MPHADFVHLRVHSAYSLSEGAIKLKELIELCRRQLMPAVAVTDTGNLFGALEFALARLADLFPGRLYVEVMRHGLESESRIEDRLIELAYARDLPLVATNEAFFADRAMFEAHDALLCIAGGAYITQEERRRVTPE